MGARCRFARLSWWLGRFSSTMPLASVNDSGAQAPAQFVGKFVKMGLPVYLDGHLGGVANDVAVMAPLQMVFQFGLGLGVHGPVEVIG